MSAATRAFDKLVGACLAYSYAKGDAVRLFRSGKYPLKEHMKPGHLLAQLSSEERTALASLTSDDVRQRAIRSEWTPF